MADCTLIGDHAKLWQQSKASPTKHLMVSAHGGPSNAYTGLLPGRQLNPEFTVPAGMHIIFYGPHSQPLYDPGYANIMQQSELPYEIIGPGEKCPNYGLWKWQGYHHSPWAFAFGKVSQPFIADGDETYDTIAQFYEKAGDQLETSAQQLWEREIEQEKAKLDERGIPNAHKEILLKAKLNETQEREFFRNYRVQRAHMDLVSIRYRPFQVHTDLASILRHSELTRYKFIHCNFCRGLLGGHDSSENAKHKLVYRGIRDHSALKELSDDCNHPLPPADFWKWGGPNS